MPSPSSNRRILTVRVAQTGIEHLDRLASERGIDRSELIRRILNWGVIQINAGKAPELARRAFTQPGIETAPAQRSIANIPAETGHMIDTKR